ncbi:MAG: PAS domain-containing protein [Deltaproteobacteria bacterium]|nr:PAS domain-containing protein [Deltaproteobacteria bacterium]
MIRSLVFQALWAPALVLVAGIGLTTVELYDHARTDRRYAAVVDMDQRLGRALARLRERHDRTVRRTREALLETRTANQVAMLSSTAEHYLQEMERYVAEAAATAGRIAVPGATARLESDLGHLTGQLDRVSEAMLEMGPALEALLDAVSNDDDDATRVALQELDRVDRTVATNLAATVRIMEIAVGAQAAFAAAAAPLVPRFVWPLFVVAALAALCMAGWPAWRLTRLSRGAKVQPRTNEERQFAARLNELSSAQATLEATLTDRTRELERALQASRRAEQELALLRLYNENLVNSLRSAILVTDGTGHITGSNRAARQALGAETVGDNTEMQHHPLTLALVARGADVKAEVERAMRERVSLRYEGLPYRHGGVDRLLDLTVVPYLDESGAARGLLWVADDVTEAVRVRMQLLAAERLAAVGSLSAQVAHEVRNPLSAIGLNAELLDEELSTALAEPKRAEAAALLGAIAQEIERLTQITEGYLKLARLPRPDLRAVDVNAVVADLTAMLSEELKAHGIELKVELATPPPLASCDPGQVRQALLNIVRNAREAMPDGGTLCIATRQTDTTCDLEVKDSGPGIPPALLPRVFEPFFTTKPEGTGLGLSLAHQIMTEHGGGIEIASTPGEGTKVRLHLPREPR